MLGSIYHMTLKSHLMRDFRIKRDFAIRKRDVIMDA